MRLALSGDSRFQHSRLGTHELGLHTATHSLAKGDACDAEGHRHELPCASEVTSCVPYVSLLTSHARASCCFW